ncbi:Carbapenem-hydrolyzing beta-lactamase KPC [Xylophilus ampelinus]|nr:class A beta-lactamase [Variovorax sp.]VTY39080.1 Carbapenem-hydrolyzing beta-lactamase KPC [Xylophilus ampelinus]
MPFLPPPTAPSLTRRHLLMAASLAPLATACSAAPRGASRDPAAALARLEDGLNGRLGVFAIDTASGAALGHRASERFPICSTFKAILAGAVLARGVREPGLLDERVRYTKADLIAHSPVTGRELARGMTVAELCAATVQYSDNAAANLLLRRIGGPEALTAQARAWGDSTFRLDRWETELNSALADDPRDTSTPEAMARLLRTLAVDDGLPTAQRARLQDWLRGNTTGGARIRAGMPAAWTVGDKTGTGAHGAASDIAVVWRPQAAPLVLAVYTRLDAQDAKPRDDVIAAAARIVAGWAGAA